MAIHERGVTAPIELGVSLHHLGQAYAAEGRMADAEKTLKRAVEVADRIGGNDPLIANARKSYEQVQKLASSPRKQPNNSVPAAPAPQ